MSLITLHVIRTDVTTNTALALSSTGTIGKMF